MKHLNTIKTNLQWINKSGKEMVASLNYEGIQFLVSEKKLSLDINVFNIFIKKNWWSHGIIVGREWRQISKALIKGFNWFVYNKTKHKEKNIFA